MRNRSFHRKRGELNFRISLRKEGAAPLVQEKDDRLSSHIEKSYLRLLEAGKKDEAAKALPGVSSAFDKAAKTGVIHRATADRKKSRLALRLAHAA